MATSAGIADARRRLRLRRGDRQLAGRARAGRRRRRDHAVELPAAPDRRQGRRRPSPPAARSCSSRARSRRSVANILAGRARRGRAARRRVQPGARRSARWSARPSPRTPASTWSRSPARRAPGAGCSEVAAENDQAGRAGAGRQVRQRRSSTTPTSTQGRQARRRQLLHERRPDLHRLDPHAGPGRQARRGRRARGRRGGQVQRRRPGRRSHPDRPDVLATPARPRARLHRDAVSPRARQLAAGGAGRREGVSDRATTCGRPCSPASRRT